MIKKVDKNLRRQKIHKRIRKTISGTSERPRLSIYKTEKHIYAQIIDDTTGSTLLAVSTTSKSMKEALTKTWNKDAAKKIGLELGKEAVKKGIKNVVFDRGGYRYHGRIKELADGAREAGLLF